MIKLTLNTQVTVIIDNKITGLNGACKFQAPVLYLPSKKDVAICHFISNYLFLKSQIGINKDKNEI